MKWNKILLEEESIASYEEHGVDVFSNLPPFGETVLVSDGDTVWTDILYHDYQSWGWETGDANDIEYWAYLPEPPTVNCHV